MDELTLGLGFVSELLAMVLVVEAGLIASAVFENFGYRQFVLYSRAKGLIQFVRGAKSWGDMKRRALGT